MDWKPIQKKATSAWRETSLVPSILAGWFRPGLKRITRRVVTVQLNGNPSVRAYRYPFFKRLAMRITANPVRSLLLTFLLYVATIWLGQRGCRRKTAFTDHLTNGYRGSVLAIVSTLTEYTCVVSPRRK